jgi:hypothetical protein
LIFNGFLFLKKNLANRLLTILKTPQKINKILII